MPIPDETIAAPAMRTVRFEHLSRFSRGLQGLAQHYDVERRL